MTLYEFLERHYCAHEECVLSRCRVDIIMLLVITKRTTDYYNATWRELVQPMQNCKGTTYSYTYSLNLSTCCYSFAIPFIIDVISVIWWHISTRKKETNNKKGRKRKLQKTSRVSFVRLFFGKAYLTKIYSQGYEFIICVKRAKKKKGIQCVFWKKTTRRTTKQGRKTFIYYIPMYVHCVPK